MWGSNYINILERNIKRTLLHTVEPCLDSRLSVFDRRFWVFPSTAKSKIILQQRGMVCWLRGMVCTNSLENYLVSLSIFFRDQSCIATNPEVMLKYFIPMFKLITWLASHVTIDYGLWGDIKILLHIHRPIKLIENHISI